MLQPSAIQHIFTNSSNSNLELVIKNNALKIGLFMNDIKSSAFFSETGSHYGTQVEARGQSQVY